MDLRRKPIDETLHDLRRQLADVEEQLAAQQRLLQERDALQRAIQGLEEVLKRSDEQRSDSPQTPLWQGAQEVLSNNGGVMSAKQVAERLIALGWTDRG